MAATLDAAFDSFEKHGPEEWEAESFERASSQESTDTAVPFLQRSGSAASVSSRKLQQIGSSSRKRTRDNADPTASKKPKGENNNSWPPAAAAQQQLRQAEFRNNTHDAAVATAPHSLVSAEQLVHQAGQAASEDGQEGEGCDTPLAPRFVSALSHQEVSACDELTERLRHLYEAESRCRPSTRYLEEQHGREIRPQQYLDASIRTMVVSWLVDVGMNFRLHQETPFLAVATFDRYLTATEGVARNDVQLISVACMLVAAKHEEERLPSVAEFAHIADNSFPVSQLLQMERQVLDVLSFRINTPTAHTFWSVFRHLNPMQPVASALASYLIELSLLDYEFLKYAPSEVAASAILLAFGHQQLAAAAQGLHMPADEAFEPLEARSGCRAAELSDCVRDLCVIHAQATAATLPDSHFMSVKAKYQAADWYNVSAIAPVAWLPDMLCNGTMVQQQQRQPPA